MTELRALKDKATELTAKGKLPAALEAWQAVAAAEPEEGGSHQKVAELFVKLDQKAHAVRAYEEAARRFAKKGLFFKASAVCRLVLALEPGHQRTQEMIAALFAREPLVKPPQAQAQTPVPDPSPELPSIPLFSTLTRDELKEVLSSGMEVRVFAGGEVVVAEGSAGDSMFALSEGEASVYRGWGTTEQRKVAQVATGDIFGEAAMVSGGTRLATVVLDGPGVALEFSREPMGRIVNRFARVGHMIDAFYRERLLANVLRASPIFKALPEADKQALSSAFQPSTFVDGQRIISEGQPADSVHLLLRGTCAVSHQSGERYPDLREGDLFGEVSVLSDGAATASVAAIGPVLTLRIPAGTFKARVLASPSAAFAVKTMAKWRLARTAKLDQANEPEIVMGFELEDARV